MLKAPMNDGDCTRLYINVDDIESDSVVITTLYTFVTQYLLYNIIIIDLDALSFSE